MKLIAILIFLAIRKKLHKLEDWRQPEKISPYIDFFKKHVDKYLLKNVYFRLLAMVVPPLIIIGVIQYYFSSDEESSFWQINQFIGLFLGIIALLYSIGTKSFAEQLEPIIEAFEEGDHEKASYHSLVFDTGVEEDQPHLANKIVRSLILRSNDRLFGNIFWFIVLGPFGLLWYRFIHMLHDRYCVDGECEEEHMVCDKVMLVFDFIPALLIALTYALVGSFVDAMEHCFHFSDKGEDFNENILLSSAFGALKLDGKKLDSSDSTESATCDPEDMECELDFGLESIIETRDLIQRAQVVWVLCIALLTFFGVIF